MCINLGELYSAYFLELDYYPNGDATEWCTADTFITTAFVQIGASPNGFTLNLQSEELFQDVFEPASMRNVEGYLPDVQMAGPLTAHGSRPELYYFTPLGDSFDDVCMYFRYLGVEDGREYLILAFDYDQSLCLSQYADNFGDGLTTYCLYDENLAIDPTQFVVTVLLSRNYM